MLTPFLVKMLHLNLLSNFFNRTIYLKKYFSFKFLFKKHKKNTSENYNKMVSDFYVKIKKT